MNLRQLKALYPDACKHYIVASEDAAVVERFDTVAEARRFARRAGECQVLDPPRWTTGGVVIELYGGRFHLSLGFG